VIVLGFDTATPSTAVGLRLRDGSTLQVHDDPDQTPPIQHPGHTTRLLGMAGELLTRASIGWSELERIAVGLGPGTFTGLRVGVATARGLAQSLGIELVGVSSLRALAEGALQAELDGSYGDLGGRWGEAGSRGHTHPAPPSGYLDGVLAVLDARRGEAFAAAYLPTDQGSAEELVPPRALAPEDLGSVVAQAEAKRGDEHGGRWRAIGDGAVRFRGHLEAAGVVVPPDSSPLHLLSAVVICHIGVGAEAVASNEMIVPDYRRRPDAEIALERARALEGAQASERRKPGRGAEE
jgi:tRNA threonylcarbamoyladenosine biosynthesis protein TsaB